ncbi:MAG TPA: HPr family phosphocarrier protein, partial [Ruminococcaceae bacterium]|nr:HPr family phosphocarrier protein [Oscillospiraceae bacterium]
MLTKKFVIKCDEGFHLRPAQVFVETASQYNSEFIIKKSDTEEANANSILGLMSLGLDL